MWGTKLKDTEIIKKNLLSFEILHIVIQGG